MLFNSRLYLLFLPVVAVLYYLLPLHGRRALLLLASYAFYWVWSVPFSLLLVFSTLVDYTAAMVIDTSESQRTRRLGVFVSVAANLGVLCLFKYVDFFTSSVNSIAGEQVLPGLDLVLPLGISFYTFQTMSYTIDVYRGRMRAERSPMDVALYVSFFPQLVAGPIIRAHDLLPELQRERQADWVRIRTGIAMVVWGLFKKVYIADGMAPLVNEAYNNVEAMSGFALMQATYAFAVQIYCDFSGYTDIAIGSALILGIMIPENFRSPYLSCSIREFWRRWHISLSSWLRDYLYIPLGGSRKGPTRTQVNLMITMLLGGLWHGAGWNWVVWGGLQGMFMIVERAVGLSEEHPRQLAARLLRWFVTFHLVCLSWIFFRAQDVGSAFAVIEKITTGAEGFTHVGYEPLFVVLALLIVELSGLRHKVFSWFAESEALSFWGAASAFVFFALTFSKASNPEFIYFQF